MQRSLQNVMRAGDFPKQEKCNRTDIVEAKTVRQVVQSSTEMECFGIHTGVRKPILGSPGELRGSICSVESRSFSCLTVN